MSTYTIGQVADRSGFSPSALRYYERIGVLEPSTRTEAGYRVYDDDTLGRLAFIARAKELGCSLEEITDLVEIWDGEQCGPVQRRFHELVTAKVADAQRRITELIELEGQLRAAATHLGGAPIDGPCGTECACLLETPAAEVPPIACTLSADDVPGRLAEWHTLLGQARSRAATDDGGVRVQFGDDVSMEALARLVAAEQACSAFLSFTITVDPRGLALEVRAPDGAADVVDALFPIPPPTP